MYLTILIQLYNNMYMHLRSGNGVNICEEIKWLHDKRFSSILFAKDAMHGNGCREAAEYLKVLDNICSYCKQTFQLQLSQTREILRMSQSKDMSQVGFVIINHTVIFRELL